MSLEHLHVDCEMKADDTEGAAEELTAILGFAPEHEQARQMLLDLGYDVPTAQYTALDAVDRMVGLVRSTDVNPERMEANLAMSKGVVVAEPLYILLALKGVGSAHELSRRLSLSAREHGVSVLEAFGSSDHEPDGL